MGQISGAAMKAWLAFWASSMHQPMLYRLQQVSSKRAPGSARSRCNTAWRSWPVMSRIVASSSPFLSLK
jgi:hypothetical protein